MTTRRIAVVSAGLSNPSSTRMLADRLAGEPRVERLLEPALPRQRAVGEPALLELCFLGALRDSKLAGHVDRRAADRRAAGRGRSLGQRRAVLGEDRRSLWDIGATGKALTLG